MGSDVTSAESALFRPAGLEISSGAKTGHGEPIGPRATASVSPWSFLRRSRLPIQTTSDLPNAAPLRASLLRCVPGGVVSSRQDGDEAGRNCWATMLFRESRVRFRFGGVDPVAWGTQTSGRTLRGRGVSAASAWRFAPRTFLRGRTRSDVREPAKRSRRSCGVAMSAFEETDWSG